MVNITQVVPEELKWFSSVTSLISLAWSVHSSVMEHLTVLVVVMNPSNCVHLEMVSEVIR